MIREIGSEFNLNISEKKSVYNNRTLQRHCWDFAYTRSGREAIGFILDDINPNTRTAILPAYICRSMLEPFVSRGYTVKYFGIDDNFNPDIKELESLLKLKPDIILVIDWFGMDKNKEVVSLTRQYSKEMIVLSDCTHNYFNDSLPIDTDFIIASLRKWLPLPDGGIAINCKSKFKNKLEYIENSFVDKRIKAMLMKTEYLNTGEKGLKSEFRKLLSEAEGILNIKDLSTSPLRISPLSLSLLNQTDLSFMKMKRRENFNVLSTLIDREIGIPIINNSIKNFECPFSFPIIVKNNREKLQLWLAKNDIYCQVLWPLPGEIYTNYKTASYLSYNMLSIPCDQRYSKDDMEYIAELINSSKRVIC